VVLSAFSEVASAPELRSLVRDVGGRGVEVALETPYRTGGECAAQIVVTDILAFGMLGV
jgi:hypothetical protein